MPIHSLANLPAAQARHDKWQYQPSWGHTP